MSERREPQRGSGAEDRLYTVAEAAAYLNVPFTTLQKKVSRREVEFTRVFRHVRFTRAQLDRLVAAGRQDPSVRVPPPGNARTRL